LSKRRKKRKLRRNNKRRMNLRNRKKPKRRNNPRRKNSQRRSKTKRRKSNLMLSSKKMRLTLKKRKSILSTYSLNLLSILTIGKDNFVIPLIKPQLLSSCGANLTTKDGLSGKFTTLNTKERELLDT